MEPRKYQLQKQIIEAHKAKDDELYSLLKSQWAHRFGVESLEELEQLDLTSSNQETDYGDTKKNYRSQDLLSEDSNQISIKEVEDNEEPIKNEMKKEARSVGVDNQYSHENKSYKIQPQKNYDKKNIKKGREIKTTPKVDVLIPLPPKPKYNYLKKWLVRN